MKKYTKVIFIMLLICIAVAAFMMPAQASDGKIMFTSDMSGNNDVYMMNEDGSGLIQLTDNPAYDGEPVLSPDGSKIAFTSRRDGNEEVYLMKVDGSGQVGITNNDANDRDPAWSPDGSKIAFESDRDGKNEIYVMNVNSQEQPIDLTNNGANNHDPAWSPDGSKIAFSSDRDHPNLICIYLMNEDGTGQTQLTNIFGMGASCPAWSPDGSRIAFSGNEGPGVGSQIYVINTDGTGQERLTDYGFTVSRLHPSWSPDGSQIAFTSQEFVIGELNNHEINVMNSDGSGKISISNNEFTNMDPAWGVLSDTTPPEITINTPTNDAVYMLGQSVLADWAVTDAMSGVASSWGTKESGIAIDTSTVGVKEFTVTAKDNAGNTNTVTYHYTVAYAYTPVTPSYSTKITQVKLGSGMPIRIMLNDSSGNPITNAVVKLYLARQIGSNWGQERQATSLTNPKNSNTFRYDPLKGQYVYNLDTKPLATGTWELRIKLDDGTTQTMTIRIVK